MATMMNIMTMTDPNTFIFLGSQGKTNLEKIGQQYINYFVKLGMNMSTKQGCIPFNIHSFLF